MSEPLFPGQPWQTRTLGSVARYINGRAFRPDEWKHAGLPIIRIQQMNNRDADLDFFDGAVSEAHRIDDGDLLFSWSATLVTQIWDRGPAVLNQHIFKVVPEPTINLHFLHHLLEFEMDGLAGETHGSTMKHIKRSDLLPYEVDVPPLPEQRRIAEVLDTADEAIRQTEALIAKLKQMKQGLLHDLLTRGLDENGELRDPVAHPEQFKGSPLGRIPRGWEAKPLGRFIMLQRGFDITNASARPGDVPIVSSSGPTGFHDTAVARAPGVVTGRKGTLGQVFYVDQPFWPHDTTLWVKNFYESHPRFVYRFLTWLRIERFAASTANPTLNRNQVHPTTVAFPPPPEQEKIANILDAHDARIRAEEAYRDKLQLLKKGLMQDLLTGRVRVPVHEGEPEFFEVGA